MYCTCMVIIITVFIMNSEMYRRCKGDVGKLDLSLLLWRCTLQPQFSLKDIALQHIIYKNKRGCRGGKLVKMKVYTVSSK